LSLKRRRTSRLAAGREMMDELCGPDFATDYFISMAMVPRALTLNVPPLKTRPNLAVQLPLARRGEGVGGSGGVEK
jgi:hypothetical protein